MRFDDWPKRLNAEIEAARSRKFEYGGQDCMLFLADCVHAITGIDYARELRGYKSKEEAYAIVGSYGSLESMITSLLGRDPIHPAFAKRGDVMLINIALATGESGESGAICDGVKLWTPQDIGLRAVPRSAARLAWSIE